MVREGRKREEEKIKIDDKGSIVILCLSVGCHNSTGA